MYVEGKVTRLMYIMNRVAATYLKSVEVCLCVSRCAVNMRVCVCFACVSKCCVYQAVKQPVKVQL
jgi:hypothetical protein